MARELEVIRSRANAALKRVSAARAGRRGDHHETEVVLEGERLVRDAVEAELELELLVVREDRTALLDELGAAAKDVRVVQADLFDRISVLTTSPGVLALARPPRSVALDELAIEASTLLLVVDGVSDPGNLGALARSAEAAGVTALIVVPGGARPWSEKALRGSMGSLLRVPIVTGASADQVTGELALRGVRQVRAVTRGGTPFDELDWSGAIAVWVTGETGAPPIEHEDHELVSIPMSGSVESLNVTVAASLLLFAAGRTKGVR